MMSIMTVSAAGIYIHDAKSGPDKFLNLRKSATELFRRLFAHHQNPNGVCR